MGNKERQERDDAIRRLIQWIQTWRPVIFITVPGAETKIRALPSSGAPPDDVIRVVEDMSLFIQKQESIITFKESALNELNSLIESARKETAEATAALPQEAVARQALPMPV